MSNNLLKQLARVLEELDAELITTTKDSFEGTFASFFESNEISKAAVTDDKILNDLNVPGILKGNSIKVVLPLDQVANPMAAGEWKTLVAESDIGITSAEGIAAETASALLLSGNPDLRAVSLLPERHLIILEEDKIVPDIKSLVLKWIEKGNTLQNAVMVSGPSRTADIEKELVLGVHGPSMVSVLVVTNND